MELIHWEAFYGSEHELDTDDLIYDYLAIKDLLRQRRVLTRAERLWPEYKAESKANEAELKKLEE